LSFLEVFLVFYALSIEEWKLILVKEEYTDFIEPIGEIAICVPPVGRLQRDDLYFGSM